MKEYGTGRGFVEEIVNVSTEIVGTVAEIIFKYVKPVIEDVSKRNLAKVVDKFSRVPKV